MPNSFQKHLSRVISSFTVNHITFPYDPALPKVEATISSQEKAVIQAVSNSEIFWRQALGPEGFAEFEFPWNKVCLSIQFSQAENALYIEWRSRNLIQTNEKIAKKHLPCYFKGSAEIPLLQAHAQAEHDNCLPKPITQPIRTDITPNNLPETLGFTPDPGIAKLVSLLNSLGLHTTQSCEGHPDRLRPYPWIDFPMLMLYPLLTTLYPWPQAEHLTLTKLSDQFFRLNFRLPTLTSSQELAQGLTHFLSI